MRMKTLLRSAGILLFLSVAFAPLAWAKDGDVKICGTIEAITADAVTLNGVSYSLESGTEYEDANGNKISRSDFAVGELIELRLRNGKVDQLEKENEANCGGSSSGGGSDSSGDDSNDDDSKSGDDSKSDDSKKKDDSNDDSSDDKGSDDKGDRSRVCGQIDAISSSSITVDGQVYAITSGTEFESNSGESLSYLAFSVGDFVKLDIRSGSLHEVEFETSASCRSSKVVSSNQKKDQNSSTLRRTRLKTKLTASAGVSTSARGQAQYIARAKKGKSRDQFKVKVLVPVPSTNPVLTDSGQASLLNLSVYIQRGVDTLAICTLEFDEVENSMAEYKIDLKEHDGSFRAKKGDCDIDPAQSGTQSGIPSFNSGDTIMVVTEDLSGLLEGQL